MCYKVENLIIKVVLVISLIVGQNFSITAEEHYTNVGDKLIAADTIVESGSQYKNIPITLDRNVSFENFSDNFTNIQFQLVFPDGVRPILKSDGTANIGKTDDCKYYDEDEDSNLDAITWKATIAGNTVTVIGVNLNKHKLTKNPIELCKISYETTAGIKPGKYAILAQNIKYTSYNNDDFKTVFAQTLCTLTIEGDDTPYTDVTKLPYAIYCNEFKTRKNKQVEVKINMKNASSVCLWQADMVLPQGFSVATDEDNDALFYVSGTRTTSARHNIATNTLGDGSTRILCSSTTNKNFSDNDGEVATFILNTPSDAVDGEYPLIFRNVLLVEDNAINKYTVDSVVSKIVVKNFMLGDVNDDEQINGIDLVGMTNFILEKPNEGCIWEAADVNIDGEVNGSDYVLEVNAILGLVTFYNAPAINKVAVAESPAADYAIYSENVATDADCIFEVPISVKNANNFTLWQADFELPEGFTVALDEEEEPMISITGGRTTYKNHAISSNTLADGSLRVMCSSPTNKEFKGNDGEVATIGLFVAPEVASGNYVIKIKKGLVVEANNTGHEVNDFEITVSVNGSTGINDISLIDGKVNVYNVYGQVIKTGVDASVATEGLSKGIYIVGNKKMIIK